MELSSLKNKKFKEGTFQAQKKTVHEKFLIIFREMELSSLNFKNFLYFRRELESLKLKKFVTVSKNNFIHSSS